MDKSKIWINGDQLLKRWDTNSLTVIEAIKSGLQAYSFSEDTSNEIPGISDEPTPVGVLALYAIQSALKRQGRSLYKDVSLLLFNLKDVESFENTSHIVASKMELTGKEKRELGQLRREKENWELTIEAAAWAGAYCAIAASSGSLVINADLGDQLRKKFPDLLDASIRRVQSAIPKQYKKGPGAPRKSNNTAK